MSRKPLRDRPLPPTFPGAMMIGEEEKNAAMEVLDSKNLFRYYGPEGTSNKAKKFEDEFAEYMGTKYALAVSSGTTSLITALTAADVGPGDEVIVPSYTWIASATSVVACKAIPVIAEVDKSLTLDPEDFEAKITERTKAVIPVHMRGMGCRMDEIMRIAKHHGIAVIEDTAQSCGGEYKGKKLGSIGDVGAFSFQISKVITAGEGGAVITNNEYFFERAVMIHDAVQLSRGHEVWGKFKTEQTITLNFRMNEISAAILIEQLHKLDKILSVTRPNKEKIKKGISDVAGIELREVPSPDGDTGICLMFFLPTAKEAQRFVEALHAENIDGPGYGTHVAYVPNKPDYHVYAYWHSVLRKHTFTKEGCPFTCPYYRGKAEYSEDMCPNTLDLLGRAVHIDLSPLLTEDDVDSIIEGIHKVAKEIH